MTPMKSSPQGWRQDLIGTLSIHQAARRLKLRPARLRQLLGEQRMAFVEIRGEIRVPRREIERYQQQSCGDAAQ